jgi:hypothetical protein
MLFGAILPDFIPPLGRAINSGKPLNSWDEIRRGRGFMYVFWRNIGPRIAFASIAAIPGSFLAYRVMAATVYSSFQKDERLTRIVNDLNEFVQQTMRQRGREIQEASSQNPPRLAAVPETQRENDDTWADSPATPVSGRLQTPVSQADSNFDTRNMANPIAEASWDSLLDDDASPVASTQKTAQPGSYGSPSQQLSSWDQIRRNSMATNQNRASYWPGTNSGVSQPPATKTDPAKQQQNDKTQAQKDFDALMERERQGKDLYDDGEKKVGSWWGRS